MGADRTAPVVLGPVTWVYLARHADAQASEEATIALKNQYLDAILPVYAVSGAAFRRFPCGVPASNARSTQFRSGKKSRRVCPCTCTCTSALVFVVDNGMVVYF